MLYKLFVLTILFLVCMHDISAQDDTDALTDTQVDDINTVDADNAVDDETNLLDDLDTDNDNTESPEEEGSDIETTSSSEDTELVAESNEYSSGPCGDSTSCDTHAEDDCLGLSYDACLNTKSEDKEGDQNCGYNKVSGECYAVGRKADGTFDAGYIAAQQKAVQDSKQLETTIGVLGAIVGVLTLLVIGGGYYLYNQNQNVIKSNHFPMNSVDSEAQMITEIN